MKRMALVLLLLGVSCLAFTIDFGFSADLAFSNQNQSTGGTANDDTRFIVTGSVILRLSSLMELTPYFSLYIMDDNIPVTNARTDFAAGAGLYFHFLQSPVVELSVGPKLECYVTGRQETTVGEYTDFTIGLSCPIILDIKLTKNLIIRLTENPFSFIFESIYANPGVATTTTYFNFISYANSNILSSLRVGMVFMF